MRTVESSGGVISGKDNEGRRYLLLITTPKGLLSIPKGHIEHGETPELGAIREMKEEVGLGDVELLEKLGTVSRIGTEHDGSKKEKLIHVFLMDGSGFTFDHEEDYVWISWDRAVGLMHYEEERRFLIEKRSEIEKHDSKLFKEHNKLFGNRSILPAVGKNHLAGYLQDCIASLDNPSVLVLGSEGEGFFSNIPGNAILHVIDPSVDGKAPADVISYKNILPVNILNQDLPERIDIFYSRFGINLSDMKCFFLINEVLKKMPVGGYLMMEGISSAEERDNDRVGPNMQLDRAGNIERIWNEEFVNGVAEKLKLEVSASMSIGPEEDLKKESLIIILKKVTDYYY